MAKMATSWTFQRFDGTVIEVGLAAGGVLIIVTPAYGPAAACVLPLANASNLGEFLQLVASEPWQLGVEASRQSEAKRLGLRADGAPWPTGGPNG